MSASADAADQADLMSARFASLVIQNTNMALIFLGKAPNPQTGQTARDLDHARYFIDQLEMLEVKTKGNLQRDEETLLRQSLTTLRLAFVEVAGQPEESKPTETQPATPTVDEQETPVSEPVLPGEKGASGAAEAESRKKFSKKY